jgi:hypothetical protein
MPITDQLYYFGAGAGALLFDNGVVLMLILFVLMVCFVFMLCRIARRIGDD